MNTSDHHTRITKSSSLDSLCTLNPILPSSRPSEEEPILDSGSLPGKDRRKAIIPKSHLPQQTEQVSILRNKAPTTQHSSESFPRIDQKRLAHDSSDLPLETWANADRFDLKQPEVSESIDSFDTFMITNFVPFSGTQDINRWLDETERKFNQFKFSRTLRFSSIPFLVTGEAKRKYIRIRKEIQSFDDFYEFLLTIFEKNVSFSSITAHSIRNIDPSNSSAVPIPRQAGESSHFMTNTFDNSVFSPKPPILRSTGLGDLSTTVVPTTTVSPSMKTPNVVDTIFSLDQTTNDLRKAILESFVKTPKTFHGSKDDVIKWLEELEHLFDIAQIPDTNKLGLISYSLRGDALQWYKNSKQSLSTWQDFVKEIKKAFTSSFHQELAFKKLESYTQSTSQSIRNYYNEVLKLCNEADPAMTEATKLKHLLSKAKPTIQFEVRRNKPTTPMEFLNYAKEAEELYQLSNLHVDPEQGVVSIQTSSTTDHAQHQHAPTDNNSSTNASHQRWTEPNHSPSSYSNRNPSSNVNPRSHHQYPDKPTYRNTSTRPPYSQHSRDHNNIHSNSARGTPPSQSHPSTQSDNQSRNRQYHPPQPSRTTTANINQSSDYIASQPSSNELSTDYHDHTPPPLF